MSKQSDIEEKIKRLKSELDELKASKRQIRPLSDYSDKEKIMVFDSFYGQALEHLNETESSGYADEDTANYMFESVMELLSSSDSIIWEYYNSLV